MLTNNNSNDNSNDFIQDPLQELNNNASNNVQVPFAPIPAPVDPILATEAADVVQQDSANKAAEQQVQDTIDVNAQTEQNKEVIKSQLAQENAIQAVAQETAKKESDDITQIQNEINKEQEELKNFSMEDVIKNRSTSDKVWASLAIVLGGIGQGLLRSGSNAGLDSVNKTLDAEFENQKLGRQEKLAKKQRVFDLLKLKIDSLSQQTNDKLKKDQFNLTKQDLELQKQANLQQQLLLKQQSLLSDKARQGQLNPDQESAYVASLSPEDRKRYVVGFGLAKDSESAKKAAEQINVAEQANAQIQDIRGLFKDFGTREVLDRGAVAKEQTTRRNLQLQMKELFNLGVLNGPDLKLVEEATGDDFFALTTSDAAKNAKLASIESFIKNKVNSALKNAGLNSAGESKRDKIIDKYRQEGLSDSQAMERYNKLVQSGLIK